MKKLILAALAATASLAFAPAANAAQFITISGPSGTFGDDTVACAAGMANPCSFNRVFTFVTPMGFNLASATISSIRTGTNALTNIDFSSVTLNGTDFSVAAMGDVEFRSLLNQALVSGGSNTIAVNGTTGGEGSFSGTLSFSAAAVPEPMTWAMMVIGFGAIGASMRRRRSTTRVAFAV